MPRFVKMLETEGHKTCVEVFAYADSGSGSNHILRPQRRDSNRQYGCCLPHPEQITAVKKMHVMSAANHDSCIDIIPILTAVISTRSHRSTHFQLPWSGCVGDC